MKQVAVDFIQFINPMNVKAYDQNDFNKQDCHHAVDCNYQPKNKISLPPLKGLISFSGTRILVIS